MTMITLRGLNRALLARQFLLERTDRTSYEVVRHLVAVQGQEPNWPYVGLWSRIAGFRHGDLEALLRERRVVRSTMVRRTVHLAAAEDFAWLRPTVHPLVSGLVRTSYFTEETGDLDPAEIAAAGREALAGRTLLRRELGALLAERFPGRLPMRLSDVVEAMEALVHTPDVGAWGGWGNRSGIGVSLAEEWSGLPMAEPDLDALVLRYLASYGPATVMDAQMWSGMTRLRAVFDRLRPRLRVLRDERGRELFDLPDAELPDESAPAPVRFMPAFDNALLGHKDRTRIIAEEDRRRYSRLASGGVPMFLVDGFVQGTWAVRKKVLAVAPFRPLAGDDAERVRAEAERVLEFVGAQDLVFEEEGAGRVNRMG
ncbi:winged helix DNA-binding domain-containing protein [Spirillospora sp. NPDC127200]